MSELLIFALVNSLFIIGLNRTTGEGMVFEKLGESIKDAVGEWWSKPIIGCPPCMTSIHGTWFYFAFIHQPVYLWPVYVLMLSGMTYAINSALVAISTYIEK